MKRIGIVGGGQLGRMLTIPAKEMGFEVIVLDPTPNCPASQIGAQQILGSLTDKKAIKRLAAMSDVVTFEIEHIDATTLQALAESGKPIHPSPSTLRTIKDKLEQKRFLQKQGIPTAEFMEIENEQDIATAIKKLGLPLVLKNRFGGYDGKGNAVIKSTSDIPYALKILGNKNLYAEKYVPFVKELAIMMARSSKEEITAYPVVETIHKNNILHFALAPARITNNVQKKTIHFALDVMRHLQGAGVYGIELFLTKKGDILVNEIAPRVHNSGHYTIESCTTSQFEQHIRAIAGLPLGATDMKTRAAVMANVLGKREGLAHIKGLEKILSHRGVAVHMYGKSITKPGRKMGHLTIIGPDIEKSYRLAKRAINVISI